MFKLILVLLSRSLKLSENKRFTYGLIICTYQCFYVILEKKSKLRITEIREVGRLLGF